MALSLQLGEAHLGPERLQVEATVTMDGVDGLPTIVSSELTVQARVAGVDADRVLADCRRGRRTASGVPALRRRLDYGQGRPSGGMTTNTRSDGSCERQPGTSVRRPWLRLRPTARTEHSTREPTIRIHPDAPDTASTHRPVPVVADTEDELVRAVRDADTWDRATDTYRRFAMIDCLFDEHGSRFSAERLPDATRRYVVLEVAFLFRQGDLTGPIRDPGLARLVHVEPGGRAPLSRTHEAVLAPGDPVSPRDPIAAGGAAAT